uniref:Uncharacterized protein n=1 Tax=Tanacetum cinerariifolium TaxID=118510 RepID=A0A6L2J6S0_TANCI|nr:hypothetical protein [Tanacetum cinerariifolium]
MGNTIYYYDTSLTLIKPQHTPTTASPSHIEPIPTVASSSQTKKTQKHRKTKRNATEISQSSGPTTHVADETVYEERGDTVERVATTAASLDAEQDSGNIPRTQSTALPDEPIPQGTGSETQGRYGHDIDVSASITTVGINLTADEPVTTVSAPVTTAGISVSTIEPSTPPTTTQTVIEDEDLIIAQTLMNLRTSETTTRPTMPPQQKLDPKDKGKGKMVKLEKPLKKKDQIEFDEKVARNLEAQLQAELEEEERLARQKEEKANIALIVE